MPSDDDDDRENIVTAIARGKSVREVSREFERAEAEVRSIVAEAIKRAYDGEWLRQEWTLEDHRLKMICLKNFGKAMDGEGDSTAAAIYIKASERRATLAGANAPQAYAVHLSHDAAPEQMTSTEKIKAVLDRLHNYSPREQALEDKDWRQEPMTDAEVEELDRFREEREARRRVEHDAREAQRREQRAARNAGVGAAAAFGPEHDRGAGRTGEDQHPAD
jgi:hypothetical protein